MKEAHIPYENSSTSRPHARPDFHCQISVEYPMHRPTDPTAGIQRDEPIYTRRTSMAAIQRRFLRSVRSLEPTGPAASRTVPAVDVVVVEASLRVDSFAPVKTECRFQPCSYQRCSPTKHHSSQPSRPKLHSKTHGFNEMNSQYWV